MKLISDGKPVKTKDGKYRLVEDWIFEHDSIIPKKIVPKGYKTDLASIPKWIFWWGRGAWDIAAIAHDYIYEHGYILVEQFDKHRVVDSDVKKFNKVQADWLFLRIAIAVGVNPLVAFLMFLGCLIVGRGIWHAKK